MINDKLDGTFGRRCELNGNCRVGWFSSDGQSLHGYGKDSVISQQGLFEEGMIKENSEEI